MKKIAVYGSLRLNEYNYERMLDMFGQDAIQYCETTEIDGYRLYSLGGYPAIIEGEGKLTVDILRVDDNCFKTINNMEHNANYTTHGLTVNGDLCFIYVYKGNINEKNFIKSGDWSKHLQELETNKLEV